MGIEYGVEFWRWIVTFDYNYGPEIEYNTALCGAKGARRAFGVGIFPFVHVDEVYVAKINATERVRTIESVEKGRCVSISNLELVSAVVNGIFTEKSGDIFFESAEVKSGKATSL